MEITKPLLEKVLKKPVSAFTISDGAVAGDNVAGTLVAVSVKLGSGEKLDLMFKTYPSCAEIKEMCIKFGLFATETSFYETVAPRVEALLKKKGVAGSKAELSGPKYYGGNGDATEGIEFMFMEDLRPKGYKMQDKYLCYNLEETTLVLEELGRFHASTYYWIKYEGERLFDDDPKLLRFQKFAFAGEDPSTKLMGTEMFSMELKGAVEILEFAGCKDLAARVKSKLLDQGKEKIYDMLQERFRLTDKKTFPCIVHGDLWVNNILLKYDESGALPTSVKFLDFQQSHRGSIYEDLIYFILTSTTPDFRKKYMVQVLNSYFEAFASHLTTIGCPMPIGFTRGTLIDTVYDTLKAGYLYMVFAIPLQLADPIDPTALDDGQKTEGGPSAQPPPDPAQMTPEEMMIMMKQGLEARSAMFHQQMLKSPRAIQRLIDITKEMADLNIF